MEPIHWHSFFFLLFALMSCVFAIAVVLAGNIVRMACYLVLSLTGVAGLFFLAGADFLGAMQLMVYVGGTLVLLAFGVMLTARGPFASMRSGGGQWLMAALVGASLLAVLLQTVTHVKPWTGYAASESAVQEAARPTTTRLGMGLLGVRTDQLDPATRPLRPNSTPGYVLVFEIISVHLLVVLVGAAYLARAKRRLRPPGGTVGGAADHGTSDTER
jgi:NADH-quinone oxidoreductase subunit J